jgi:hypothetical protein
LQNVTLTTTGGPTPTIEFRADLALNSAALGALIPVTASFPLRYEATDEDAAVDIIEQLATGRLYWEQHVARPDDMLDVIAKKLNRTRANCFFLSCSDPRILRIGMACAVLQPDRDVVEIAQELGEPSSVVERIRKVWGGPRRSGHWMIASQNETVAKLHILAADNHGLVTQEAAARAGVSKSSMHAISTVRPNWSSRRGSRQVQPCAHCGGFRLAETRIREIAAPLCLECRHDVEGVCWPEEYDRYINSVELYVQAGLVESCEPATPTPARRAPASLRPWHPETWSAERDDLDPERSDANLAARREDAA